MMNLSVLTDEGLNIYREYVEQTVNRSAVYKQLHNSPEGKFLLADLKADLENIRKLYSTLIPEQRDVGVALCGLQAEEFYVKRLIERLSNLKTLEANAQREREAIDNEAKRRRQKRKDAESKSEFVSSRRRQHEQES